MAYCEKHEILYCILTHDWRIINTWQRMCLKYTGPAACIFLIVDQKTRYPNRNKNIIII